MDALFVTVSVGVTEPSGYFTVTVELMADWNPHYSHFQVTVWVAGS